MAEEKHRFRDVVAPLFAKNWITLFGASLTTVSAIIILTFLAPALLGNELPVYVGMIVFLVLPGVFVAGLVFIPLGHIWEHYKLKRRKESGVAPRIDFNRRTVQHAAGILLFLTVANLFIIGSVSYKAVVYMDSVEFCGTVCHTVMEPEFTAYQESPHSRVACVECHIGPGAPWFVKAKISGVRQVFAVALDSYSKPIPSPVQHLRPSRDTCEHCHWPERFTGDRVRIINRYAEDEANTKLTSVLLMHIGGGENATGGIHSWHIASGRTTTYFATDDKRQDIALVQVTEADGSVTEYKIDGFELTPEIEAAGEWRTMDCMDCHNRPSHAYELPDKALDHSMSIGELDTGLPYLKQIALEALLGAVEAEEPAAFIETTMRSRYETDHASVYEDERDSVESAIGVVQGIFAKNVFPKMNVGWGTYPVNIGHPDPMNMEEGDFMGCFRCHDESHTTEDGDAISMDCFTCHTPLAMGEESPEILIQLGLQ